MADNNPERKKRRCEWIAVFKRTLKRSDFTHLDQIANHFSKRITPDIKSWPLEATSAIVYLEGYKMVGKVRFTYHEKMNVKFLPYFEFWKPVEIVPFYEGGFEAPSDSERQWEFDY